MSRLVTGQSPEESVSLLEPAGEPRKCSEIKYPARNRVVPPTRDPSEQAFLLGVI